MPGEIALRLCPDVLKTLAASYRVIAVTGTNGKTTTAAMIQSALQQGGCEVINNSSGANLKAGLVSCFLQHYQRNPKNERFAVLEVDEAYLPRISAELNPEIIAVTNIFRDQLDRFGTVDSTCDLIFKAFLNAPHAKLVLNGDLPMLSEKVSNPVVYYGFHCGFGDCEDQSTEGKLCPHCGARLDYLYSIYGNLGEYSCPSCGLKRPSLSYAVEQVIRLYPEGTETVINGQALTIGQPGVYNLYNGLCAFSCAREVGIDVSHIVASLANQESRFGRQEQITIGDTQLRLILVKNPAGCNEAIKTVVLEQDETALAVMLNDKTGDGTDVSWIYDTNFEALGQLHLSRVMIGGTRLYDMAIRLQTAEMDTEKFVLCQEYQDVLDAVLTYKPQKLYMLATYSAMVEFRRFLFKKGYLKKLW